MSGGPAEVRVACVEFCVSFGVLAFAVPVEVEAVVDVVVGRDQPQGDRLRARLERQPGRQRLARQRRGAATGATRGEERECQDCDWVSTARQLWSRRRAELGDGER